MKDLLSKLLNSGYFESIPVPKNAKEKEVSLEEEMLIKSEKKKQLLKTESVKESGLFWSLRFFIVVVFLTLNQMSQIIVKWLLCFNFIFYMHRNLY